MRGNPVRSLGPQPVPLLDTESVLLVDDDHAQAVELDGILQQGVGADHDSRLTRGDLAAGVALLLRCHRPGQQRHPGPLLGTPELTGAPQRTKHRTDRQSMLCGKDFRRRQQRALVPGVDHLQHRQQRHDSLARADLALQHPVHRTWCAELL